MRDNKMRIIEIKHITSTNATNFTALVKQTVNELQSKGLVVEIQYQVTNECDEVSAVVYSALIIGRRTEAHNGNAQL